MLEKTAEVPVIFNNLQTDEVADLLRLDDLVFLYCSGTVRAIGTLSFFKSTGLLIPGLPDLCNEYGSRKNI